MEDKGGSRMDGRDECCAQVATHGPAPRNGLDHPPLPKRPDGATHKVPRGSEPTQECSGWIKLTSKLDDEYDPIRVRGVGGGGGVTHAARPEHYMALDILIRTWVALTCCIRDWHALSMQAQGSRNPSRAPTPATSTDDLLEFPMY